jgi:calcineurin-like phosphoesterase family protein
MGWYFTADWHLNHANIIKYCDRPFLNPEERDLVDLCKKNSLPLKSVKISKDSVDKMNETIIDSTNKVVGESDNLVILGDFCWTSTPKEQISNFMSKLRCKNVYLVWGNHDNRQNLAPYFKATYDYYTFYIERTHIFVSHYPCRSWHLSCHGSWMLYGHVHNNHFHLDNGLLSSNELDELKTILEPQIQKSDLDSVLISISKLFRKPSFSLDVGVDNPRVDLPFGTPWGFNEIKVYMENKLLS